MSARPLFGQAWPGPSGSTAGWSRCTSATTAAAAIAGVCRPGPVLTLVVDCVAAFNASLLTPAAEHLRSVSRSTVDDDDVSHLGPPSPSASASTAATTSTSTRHRSASATWPPILSPVTTDARRHFDRVVSIPLMLGPEVGFGSGRPGRSGHLHHQATTTTCVPSAANSHRAWASAGAWRTHPDESGRPRWLSGWTGPRLPTGIA